MTTLSREPRYTVLLWRLWLVIGWGLPAIYAITQFWTVAEMPELGMWIAFFILLAGALGLLPRRVLRRRGDRALPASMAPVLIAYWWCWVILIYVHVTTSARIYKAIPLLEPLGVSIYENLATSITLWTMLTGAVTFLVLLVMSFMRRLSNPRRMKMWRAITVAAAFGVPLLLVVFSVGSHIAVLSKKDAAGDTVMTAQKRTFNERVDLVRENYEAVQRDISEVRDLIDHGFGWTSEEAFINQTSDSARQGAESYAFHIAYELNSVVSVAEVKDALRYLESKDWNVEETAKTQAVARFQAHHEDGRMLIFDADNSGSRNRLRYFSQKWWTGDDEGAIGAACPLTPLSEYFSSDFQQLDIEDEDARGKMSYSGQDWPEC